jgi:hypothetical protein
MTRLEVKDMLPQKLRPNRAVSLLRRETLCILIKGKQGRKPIRKLRSVASFPFNPPKKTKEIVE